MLIEMKKVFLFFAVVAAVAFASCNKPAPVVEAEDTVAVEAVVEDSAAVAVEADTTVVEVAPVAE
jgi:hypothetical protein